VALMGAPFADDEYAWNCRRAVVHGTSIPAGPSARTSVAMSAAVGVIMRVTVATVVVAAAAVVAEVAVQLDDAGLVRVRIHAVVPAVAAVSTAPGPEATRAARADRTKRSASVRAAVATDPNTMATRTAAVRARHRVARIPNRSRAVVAVSRQRPEVAKTDVMIEAIQDDTSS